MTMGYLPYSMVFFFFEGFILLFLVGRLYKRILKNKICNVKDFRVKFNTKIF